MSDHNSDVISPQKEKPDIGFPNIVHDHQEQILQHKPSSHHEIEVPKQVYDENDEEGLQKALEDNKKNRKSLPHLQFDDKNQNSDITMQSLGVRTNNINNTNEEKPLTKSQEILLEVKEEDEKKKVKLRHLEFLSKNEKDVNIGFQGKKLANNSRANTRIRSQSMNLNEIMEEEDIIQRKKIAKLTYSPKALDQKQKFHYTLNKIEKELQSIVQDSKNSPKQFKKQQSLDIKESIQEREEEEEKEQTTKSFQHKNNKFGGTLKKLEKEIITGSDDVDMIRIKKSNSEFIKPSKSFAKDNKDMILEKEEKDDEDQ